MKFSELPLDIQEIAAKLLAEKMQQSHPIGEKKPAKELAHEVKEAFVSLYSDS